MSFGNFVCLLCAKIKMFVFLDPNGFVFVSFVEYYCFFYDDLILAITNLVI